MPINSKYEPCSNPSWIGATFVADEADKYGNPIYHKSAARCNSCNKFFNWRKLSGITTWPQKVDLHCPHCGNIVFETTYK